MFNNNRYAREGGLVDEILLENLYRNPEGNPLILDTILLEKVRLESNIQLFLNTALVGSPSNLNNSSTAQATAHSPSSPVPPSESAPKSVTSSTSSSPHPPSTVIFSATPSTSTPKTPASPSSTSHQHTL
ncbi:hypothetical protein LB505_013061 [Fusarium chuoi]|nr:hypothetical protein LB505_013061 [Fusarium chuoi]